MKVMMKRSSIVVAYLQEFKEHASEESLKTVSTAMEIIDKFLSELPKLNYGGRSKPKTTMSFALNVLDLKMHSYELLAVLLELELNGYEYKIVSDIAGPYGTLYVTWASWGMT